jgi:hypothetical protein
MCAAVMLGLGACSGGRVLGCCGWVLGFVCGCVALIGEVGFGSCRVCLYMDIFPVYL